MQSGITASHELHSAFSDFTSNPSLFALPVTITKESLTPLSPVPFSGSDLISSLPSLKEHLQPKIPIFLLVRKTKDSQLTAITYVPSTAPVRSKTLFASTRASLVRDLGSEKFDDTLFCTDAEEILDVSQWKERDSKGAGADGVDSALLTREERELQSVKRAEEEERHGTSGRDLMGEGGSGRAQHVSGTSTPTGRSGIQMRVADDAKAALGKLAGQNGEEDTSGSSGSIVQLGIDIPTETITLLSTDDGISPDQITSKIPSDRPSYTFYHVPSASTTLFLYVCPGSSKVKERMLYASNRNGVLEIAKGEGLVVTKKLEAGEPDDLAEPRISDELGLKSSGTETPTSRQGFARPKRPGRR